MTWNNYVDNARVDLTAAVLPNTTKMQSLMHVRDAIDNLNHAAETLEEAIDDE